MRFFPVFLYIIFLLMFQTVSAQDTVANHHFQKVNSADWKLKFRDDFLKDWKKHWFLDGLRAHLENTKHGLLFTAGEVEGDDACHAVLWTKDSFSGDIKIEYDYTRTDARKEWVNIIYIHATGTGKGPYEEDISRWNKLRMIPSMSSYFRNMNALHISYAAYDDDLPAGTDYIRVRKYPVAPQANFSKTTEISPSFFNTGLFVPGKTYHITIIRRENQLLLNVAGDNKIKSFVWDISSASSINSGRVGLRHMYTRSSLYANFKIYTIE